MAASSAAAPALTRTSALSRIYGFGSIYGKTIRDSRLAFIIAAGLLGGMSLVMGAAVSNIFSTEAARHQLDTLFGGIPASLLRLFANTDLMGDKVGTLGGYVTFKYGLIFALGTALWSVMALSGTLAGEARRASLDFVAATPFGTAICRAIAMLSAAVSVGSRLYFWNTNPTSVLRRFVRSASLIFSRSLP